MSDQEAIKSYLSKHLDSEIVDAYLRYRDEDPFPQIPAALLNSADIQDYARVVGMVTPIVAEDKDFWKPASYSIKIGGEYMYWENENAESKKSGVLEKRQELRLRKNSITFVSIEPYILLPNYIAARFNLQIHHVHKGLLLGTGPLVDPGYTGKLYIPLHNLTHNEYIIREGDPLIWMEFTKISSYEKLKSSNPGQSRTGKFNDFAIKPYRKSLAAVLNEAHPNSPIPSSLPSIEKNVEEKTAEFEKLLNKNIEEINTAKAKSEKLEERVDTAKRSINTMTIIATIAYVGTFGTFLFTGINTVIGLSNTTNSYIQKSEEKQRVLEKQIEEQRKQLEQLKSDMRLLRESRAD